MMMFNNRLSKLLRKFLAPADCVKSYQEDIDLPINKGAVLPKRGIVNLRGCQFSGGVDLFDSIHELTITLPTGSDHRRGRPAFSRNGHG
jgi:hypothetical protein